MTVLAWGGWEASSEEMTFEQSPEEKPPSEDLGHRGNHKHERREARVRNNRKSARWAGILRALRTT